MANDDKDVIGELRGAGRTVSELDLFLTSTLARQFEAERALINGDPEQRLAMTSIQDPVTVFGAKVPVRRGWDEASGTIRWLASRWSNGTDYRFDFVAAGVSGDLAYVVGFERIANSVNGVPVVPYTLRVTHIFRRENDEWKIAHRHADYVPIDQTLQAET
jgi:ketosteroid isomerase-like protein